MQFGFFASKFFINSPMETLNCVPAVAGRFMLETSLHPSGKRPSLPPRRLWVESNIIQDRFLYKESLFFSRKPSMQYVTWQKLNNQPLVKWLVVTYSIFSLYKANSVQQRVYIKIKNQSNLISYAFCIEDLCNILFSIHILLLARNQGTIILRNLKWFHVLYYSILYQVIQAANKIHPIM